MPQPDARHVGSPAQHEPGRALPGHPGTGSSVRRTCPRVDARGLSEPRVENAHKSLEIRRGFGDWSGQGQSLHYDGVVLYAGSQFWQCIEKCREAIRLLERTGDYWQVHIARYQIAASLYRLGDLAGALEEAQLNYRSGIELGDEQASGINLDLWVRATGAVPDSILERELGRPRHDVQGKAQVLFADALQMLGNGHLEEAEDLIQEAISVGWNGGVRNAYTLPCLPWLATILRQQVTRLHEQTPYRARGPAAPCRGRGPPRDPRLSAVPQRPAARPARVGLDPGHARPRPQGAALPGQEFGIGQEAVGSI